MQHDGVETGIGKRQIGKIALHQLDLRGRQMLQLGPRHAQHFKILVERDDAFGLLGEQLGHAARAGADIEHLPEWCIGQCLSQTVLDLGVGAVKRAQFVPLARVAGEILPGNGFARFADRREFAAVGRAQRRKAGSSASAMASRCWTISTTGPLASLWRRNTQLPSRRRSASPTSHNMPT